MILGLPYDEKVDVWSVGCIFAELINQTVLFPGTDRIDQWTRIVNVLGTPQERFISRFLPPSTHLPQDSVSQREPMFVRCLEGRRSPSPQLSPTGISSPRPRTRRPASLVSLVSREKKETCSAAIARDLLDKMLKIDPEERYTVDECINHPYVRMWIRDEEVNAPQSENRYDSDIDFAEKTLSEWKGSSSSSFLYFLQISSSTKWNVSSGNTTSSDRPSNRLPHLFEGRGGGGGGGRGSIAVFVSKEFTERSECSTSVYKHFFFLMNRIYMKV